MKNVSYYRHLHPENLKKLVAITKITAVSLLTVLPSTMQAELFTIGSDIHQN